MPHQITAPLDIARIQQALELSLQNADTLTAAIALSILERPTLSHWAIIRTSESCPWGPPAVAPVVAPATLQAIGYKDEQDTLCWVWNPYLESSPCVAPSVYPLQQGQLLFFYQVAAKDTVPAHKFYTTLDQLHKYMYLTTNNAPEEPAF